jgi:hypothetical protein
MTRQTDKLKSSSDGNQEGIATNKATGGDNGHGSLEKDNTVDLAQESMPSSHDHMEKRRRARTKRIAG